MANTFEKFIVIIGDSLPYSVPIVKHLNLCIVVDKGDTIHDIIKYSDDVFHKFDIQDNEYIVKDAFSMFQLLCDTTCICTIINLLTTLHAPVKDRFYIQNLIKSNHEYILSPTGLYHIQKKNFHKLNFNKMITMINHNIILARRMLLRIIIVNAHKSGINIKLKHNIFTNEESFDQISGIKSLKIQLLSIIVTKFNEIKWLKSYELQLEKIYHLIVYVKTFCAI